MANRPAILASALFILPLIACGHDSSLANVPVPSANLVEIELTPEEALRWEYRAEMTSDLDGDGESETITLASDVTVSDTGRPLWEDGHRWAVVIEESSVPTLAYAAFVPWGFVEIALLHRSDDGTREILVNERTPVQLMSLTISYASSGRVDASSASYYQIESWFPRSATLPD